MPRRLTLYLADPALAVIGPEPDSMSGRVNSIVIRYGRACREHLPQLSRGQWGALFDALNGTWLIADDATMDPAALLHAKIWDSGPEHAQKWGYDREVFTARLRDLLYIQRVAICEAVTRFWSDPELRNASLDQAIATLNLPVTE